MNVAFYSEMAGIEGSAFHMLRQARWMIEHGHGALVLSSGGPLETEYAKLGIPFVRTPSSEQNVAMHAEQLVADGAALARACRDYAIDAILAAPRFPYTLAIAAVGESVPVFLNILSSRYFVPQTPQTIAAIRKAAADGAILSTTIDDVIPHGQLFGFDPERALLAPVPIDSTHGTPTTTRDAMRAQLGIAPDDVLVFTACRLAEDRAPFIGPLAHAVARMRAAGRRVRLAIAGDGVAAARLVATSPPDTIFLGVRRDIADLLHASDIFCGEGSILGDAALARLPVILTCALNLPAQGDRAFSVFGVTSLDHLFWSSTNFAPPASFEDALAPLIDDAGLRARLAEAAYECVTTFFSIDRYMSWFLEVVGGKHPATLLPIERSNTVIVAPGGESDLARAAALFERYGDELRLGIVFEQPVPWRATYALSTRSAQALTRASRRVLTPDATRTAIDAILADPHFTREASP